MALSIAYLPISSMIWPKAAWVLMEAAFFMDSSGISTKGAWSRREILLLRMGARETRDWRGVATHGVGTEHFE